MESEWQEAVIIIEARDFGGLHQSGRRNWILDVLKLKSVRFPNRLYVDERRRAENDPRFLQCSWKVAQNQIFLSPSYLRFTNGDHISRNHLVNLFTKEAILLEYCESPPNQSIHSFRFPIVYLLSELHYFLVSTIPFHQIRAMYTNKDVLNICYLASIKTQRCYMRTSFTSHFTVIITLKSNSPIY